MGKAVHAFENDESLIESALPQRWRLLEELSSLGASVVHRRSLLQKKPDQSVDDRDSDAILGGDSTGRVAHAWCAMCGPARTNCSTLCTIRNGRWVDVEGNPGAGNNSRRGSRTLCAKGNAAMQAFYSPTRLIFPMKRIGKKGEGRFRRITWDEAMSDISSKLKEQKELYGPESYGALSPQYYAVLATLGRRFLNVHGSPN